MAKQAPSVGRILTMVLFALSCFGLLLFLWLSFGGAIPLKPRGYRIKVAIPQAAQLAQQADVRVAGVSVGKVVAKDLDPNGNRTIATIEFNRKFSPLHKNAHVELRQKTLLGETYLEFTPGSSHSPPSEFVPENGRLADARVQRNVYLDDILTALDPQTRNAFHIWQQSLARGSTGGRGQDLNDTFGNLPSFTADATDLLRVLDAHEGAVHRLIGNTGVVFDALSRNQAQLHNLVVNSERTFSATASQNEALAESFRIFPTFLDESKATFVKLERFARNTDPLVRDLRPVARDLVPTLRDVRRLAPDLRRFFINLGCGGCGSGSRSRASLTAKAAASKTDLITASKTGLPALRDTLNALDPTLQQLGPFLSQLNPILQWIEQNQPMVSDFLSAGPAGLSATTPTGTLNGGIGHYLRQNGPTGSETLSISQMRGAGNRGNAYLMGEDFVESPTSAKYEIAGNFDCKNTPSGGPKLADPNPGTPGNMATPGCFIQPNRNFQGLSLRFPHVNPADYSKP